VKVVRRQVDISTHVGQARGESKEKVREWVYSRCTQFLFPAVQAEGTLAVVRDLCCIPPCDVFIPNVGLRCNSNPTGMIFCPVHAPRQGASA
jgi:hypothetical protein